MRQKNDSGETEATKKKLTEEERQQLKIDTDWAWSKCVYIWEMYGEGMTEEEQKLLYSAGSCLNALVWRLEEGEEIEDAEE